MTSNSVLPETNHTIEIKKKTKTHCNNSSSPLQTTRLISMNATLIQSTPSSISLNSNPATPTTPANIAVGRGVLYVGEV